MTARVSYFPGVLPPEAAAPAPAEADVAEPGAVEPDQVGGSTPEAAAAPVRALAPVPLPEAATRTVRALAPATLPESPESESGGPTAAPADARPAPMRWVIPAATSTPPAEPRANATAPAADKPLPTVWWNEEEPAESTTVETPGSSVTGPARSGAFEDDDDEPEFEDEPMSEGERAAFLENIVVRALARKGLSEWEITKLLTSNGVEEHELEPFLERYRDNRYIDDFDLAQTLVESLHRRKGYGRSQIKSELSARHIQPEIVSAALESLDDDDELRRAVEIAEKRAPSLARLDAATAERRLTSFLMRKGYPSAIIRTAVSAALTPQSRGVRFR